MKEGVGEHPGCFGRIVGCCIAWHVNVMRKKFDGTCDPFCPCFCYVYRVTSVVLWRTADVPTIDTMWRPCPALLGVFVYQCSGSWWCERRFVIVEGTVELRFGGEAGVDVGLAQEVQ